MQQNKDTRPRYPTICPVCGKTIYVCKSMAMEMGIPMGSGSCCFCNSFLHLSFENDEMKAVKFEDWRRERDENNESNPAHGREER